MSYSKAVLHFGGAVRVGYIIVLLGIYDDKSYPSE